MASTRDRHRTSLGLIGLSVVALGAAGGRIAVSGPISTAQLVALVPVVAAALVLGVVGYRYRSRSGEGNPRHVLGWTVAAAVAVGLAIDAVLVGDRFFAAPLDPVMLFLSVCSVGAAAGAVAATAIDRSRTEAAAAADRLDRLDRLVSEVDGVVLVRLDAEGYITGWNAGAEAQTAIPRSDALGQRLEFIYPDDGIETAKQQLQRALREDFVEIDGPVRRADGSRRRTSGTLTAVRADGRLLGYMLVLFDRTADHERLRQLERRNDQLEAFASVVSHDLRNPLNVAIGNVQMARNMDDDEPLDRVEDALERMDSLIGEVLTLARQGRDVESFERVDLEEAAQLAWGSIGELTATLETDALPVISADSERVRRLFENLFRNAIDHGGEAVTVRVGLLEDGFYVADDGPGIAEHERDRVFDPDYTSGEAGTGLGLPIVKGIAEAHDWSVSLTESDAGGARFEFRNVQTLAAR